MFRFIKKVLILVLISTVYSLKCILLKNQEFKVREVLVNNDYITFPYNIEVNKCIGSCNSIRKPYSRVCIPYFIKNISAKVFDLISQ